MLRRPIAAVVVAASLLGAACARDEPTAAGGASPLDPVALNADVNAAAGVFEGPATAGFLAVGDAIDRVLGGTASALIAAVPTDDPIAAADRLRPVLLRAAGFPNGAAIPPSALGVTFEYDPVSRGYVAGSRGGAPANGARFVLYAINPLTGEPAVPLVETGWADLSRTVTNAAATARAAVFQTGASPRKVLDYSAALQGTIVAPSIVASGFAVQGRDSLAFTSSATISLASGSITLDQDAALPSRGVRSRLQQTVAGGDNPAYTLAGEIAGRAGTVGLAGTLTERDGGTLTVSVNDRPFATIALDAADDPTPTIRNANGQPLSAAETAALQAVLGWFKEAFAVFSALLTPVATLLGLAF
jgi:hypothetical protein